MSKHFADVRTHTRMLRTHLMTLFHPTKVKMIDSVCRLYAKIAQHFPRHTFVHIVFVYKYIFSFFTHVVICSAVGVIKWRLVRPTITYRNVL